MSADLDHLTQTNRHAPQSRVAWVAAGVLCAHVGGLWALQHLVQMRPASPITPAEILVEVTLAPAPAVVTPAPAPVTAPTPPKPAPKPKPTAQPAPPQPLPQAVQTTPAPTPDTRTLAEPAPVSVASALPATPPSPVVAATPAAAGPRPTAPTTPSAPTPPRIELPSSQAQYLNNPPPAYPRLSRRLGEQGKGVLRVLIGTDGKAEQAQIHTSSGYDRLDQTALATVLGWRYVPGKRNGVAEAMWFNVPIQFVLE